jgi:hypothetical protein
VVENPTKTWGYGNGQLINIWVYENPEQIAFWPV